MTYVRKKIHFKCLKKALIEYLNIHKPEIFKPYFIEKQVKELYLEKTLAIGYYNAHHITQRNITGVICQAIYKITPIINIYERKIATINGVTDSLGNNIPSGSTYYKRIGEKNGV
jgi:hypothetical protein